MTVSLSGEGAEIDIIGFIIGKRNETFPFEIAVIHRSPGTRSNTEIRSVLNENTSADIHGMVKIEKNARKADAYFAAHTLLMSEHTRVKTLPALEIEANDVKASHAASIGKMDAETLFYVRARGYNVKEAKQIMVKSFLEQGLQKIADEKLREKTRAMLSQHL